MSDAATEALSREDGSNIVQSESLLDRAVALTKHTERNHTESLLTALAAEALKGTVTWSKSLTHTIHGALQRIDQLLSQQLTEVLHNPELQKLEGSWRGLQHLLKNSLTGTSLKIKMISVTKKELYKDLDKAMEFDQSEIFKKLYESEYGTPGGEPYGVLIGDYEFGKHPQDIDLLTKISSVAAAAFCPFIAAANSDLLGLDNWSDLSKPRDLENVFSSAEYASWRGFRDTEDSHYVVLTMPRVLSRLPYGKMTNPVESFNFEEVALNEKGLAKPVNHNDYTWMNAAYVLGVRLTNSFSEYSFCTAIRGAEGGGKVEGLPAHIFTSDDGDVDMKCPTEIGITDRREAELSKAGLLPLSHYKNTDYAVFFGAQSTQKPKKYDSNAATANAAICARLPYIMVVSRIAHYLKVMARDKIGSFMEVKDVEKWLNKWIISYTNANPDSGPALKSEFPLAEAKIQVKEVPGSPGSYSAVAWMRPWLQLEQLTASMRLVASIPKKG